MWRMVADENFNGDVLRGLLRVRPDLDVVRAQDVGLVAVDDPGVLAWAADAARVVLTHDKATMTAYAYARLAGTERMPGMIVVVNRLSVGQAIQEIRLLVECSDQSEWDGRVVYLPL